jgi:DNA-binding NarL/FixJ family response regulator
MAEPIHLVIIDDHPLFREGVANTLRADPDIELVGEGQTADDAVQLAGDLLPDLILLDITIPGGGLRAAQLIAAAYPVIKIVMLTASEDEDDVLAALKAGARGYILKGVSARELIRIIRAVAAGEGYVPPSLAASLLAEMTGSALVGHSVTNPLDELSERERQILEGVAGGLSNK